MGLAATQATKSLFQEVEACLRVRTDNACEPAAAAGPAWACAGSLAGQPARGGDEGAGGAGNRAAVPGDCGRAGEGADAGSSAASQAAAAARDEEGGPDQAGGGAVGPGERGRAGGAVGGRGALRLARREWEGLVLRHLAVHTDRLGAREDFALACRWGAPARPAACPAA